MSEIKNYEIYTNRMKLGLYDKCWWIDKVLSKVNTVIDFGCANGDLRDMIEAISPNRFRYIGIEANDVFYNELDRRNIRHVKNIECIPDGEINWGNAVLVMNSVIHEIYNYYGDFEFLDIVSYCVGKGVRHIAIRDMNYDINIRNLDMASAEALLNNLKGVSYRFALRDSSTANEYFKTHGDSFKNLIEYFLKYRYTENWERESKEDYFCSWMSDLDEWLSLIDDMVCEYVDFFTILPQIRQIEEDFSIKWDKAIKTHAKVLWTNEG